MKRFLIWLFTEALSTEVNGIRYIPDWNAIGAVAGAAAAAIGLVAIWYSIRIVRQQIRHQTELEAKQLEKDLLLRVMELAQLPYEASKQFVVDIITWRLLGGETKNPEYVTVAARKALEVHRQFSTATATALNVIRRSRPRRFPRGTVDDALASYDELIQRIIGAHAAMLEYGAGEWATLDLIEFEESVGSTAVELSNLVGRVTGELIARMYAEDDEWRPMQFVQLSNDRDSTGRIPLGFANDSQLGTRR